jgi:hypothetical protein
MKKKNLLMTAIAIFGLATITIAQIPSYVPTNGLIGWWPFNGNANDESGNGNNGTVNGASLVNDRFGIIDKAYNFDGIDDFISITNSSSLSIPNDISIGFWLNANSNTTGFVIDRDICGIAEDWQIVWVNDKIGFYSSASSVFTNTISTGTWNYITVTRNANLFKVYFNSSLIDSLFISNIPFNNTSLPIYFSDQVCNSNSAPNLNGQLDDIGIWNRALTQQEILDLYNGCQLSVNTQPNNQTININNNAQFTVVSSDPSANYQWQADLGVGFQNLNNVGQYSGTTTNALSVFNVTISNNNQPFRCIVSSGSCSDTSNVAVLNVNNNVGINENSQEILFSVFPNPAQSIINVKADTKLYAIYDNTGRVVLTGNLNSQNTTIELGTLSGGIYMFSVGENMNQTFKVIKE